MKKILIALTILLTPVLASAQVLSDVNAVTDRFTQLSNTFVTILISLAVLWIIYSIVRYVIAGDSEKRKEGGQHILWGVVGIFVIFSIWGLVNILRNTFKVDERKIDSADINKLIPAIPRN